LRFFQNIGLNNWNYTVAAFRDWYTANHLHFLQEGMDFWWNDEGERRGRSSGDAPGFLSFSLSLSLLRHGFGVW
jgi:hypothetical protein